MNEVKIDRTNKPAFRLGTIFGKVIGAIVVTAVTALIVTGFIWVIVSMWRSILG